MSIRETWIILGASSAMARAFARTVAKGGCDVVLAGRDHDDAERSAQDLCACYDIFAHAVAFDATDHADREKLAAIAQGAAGVVNIALMFGNMPAQSAMDTDMALAAQCLDANFNAAVLTLHQLAPVLEKKKSGCIVGVGSVAGDRGRLPNYVYGAAKAGFHTYLQGLRNRLGRSGVHVMTVKPGFVDTAMTFGLPGLFLVASPEQLADAIVRGVERGRLVMYMPWFWRYILLILRHIPERIFMRLKI